MHDRRSPGGDVGFWVPINEAVEEVDQGVCLEVGFWGHRGVREEAGGEEGDGGVVVRSEGEEFPEGGPVGVAVFWVAFAGVVGCGFFFRLRDLLGVCADGWRR